MKITVVETAHELREHFGFRKEAILLETDLGIVETDCDIYERKIRDALSICTIAANSIGPALEIGTSTGRGAFKIATNKPTEIVHTVNLLPEQYDSRGLMPTHLLPENDIGVFYRERGITNVRQHFANTLHWEVPDEVQELGLVFIDGDHCTEVVLADSEKFYKLLRQGGFLLWHDFSPTLRSQFEWIDTSMRGVELFLQKHCPDAEIVWLRDSWVGILRRREPTAPRALSTVVQEKPPQLDYALFNPESEVLREMKRLRYAHLYGEWDANCTPAEEKILDEYRAHGYDVQGFPLSCPGGWWSFPKLHEAWIRRDPHLMNLYERLADFLSTRDVAFNEGGSMLHPDFIRALPTYNVIVCADDPESSEILSRPVATSYDFCMPMNIACLDDYRSWGVKNVGWKFHGILPNTPGSIRSAGEILNGNRSLDISMLCERVYGCSDRPQRIEHLMQHFPQALVRGKGWPGGRYEGNPFPDTKIGWNLHNSVGPVNSRVVELPLYGVMQICDNKSFLGKMFHLDHEVIGFETLAECVEKTRYYLAHDNERREVAARGWTRIMRDYTKLRQWEKSLLQIAPFLREKPSLARS